MRSDNSVAFVLLSLTLSACVSPAKRQAQQYELSRLAVQQEIANLQTAPLCCAKASAITFSSLQANETLTVTLDAQSQVWEVARGKTRIQGFALPPISGGALLEITKIANRGGPSLKPIFSPAVVLLDGAHQTVAEVANPDFRRFSMGWNDTGMTAVIPLGGYTRQIRYVLIAASPDWVDHDFSKNAGGYLMPAAPGVFIPMPSIEIKRRFGYEGIARIKLVQ